MRIFAAFLKMNVINQVRLNYQNIKKANQTR